MSTYVIDSSRVDERLSAFLSEIGASEPVDNYFPRSSALKELMKDKKKQDGGRQIIFPIDSGENSTIKDFSDYDIFDTSAQDTALTVGYPMVNKGGSIVISWEEMRETAGNDHRIFDLVAHRRKNALKTLTDKLSTDLFATSQVSSKISTLAVTIDSTGSTGGLSATTDPDWASTETASGSFAAQGLTDMRTLYNTIVNNGAEPDLIVTTQSIFEFYENEIDPDVRYSTVQDAGKRGWLSLEFKGMPLIHDPKATSGVLYMITKDNLFFVVDTMGDMSIGDFNSPTNQLASTALIKFRGNLINTRRKSHGKLTGITA